jgi:hypothetical protein
MMRETADTVRSAERPVGPARIAASEMTVALVARGLRDVVEPGRVRGGQESRDGDGHARVV